MKHVPKEVTNRKNYLFESQTKPQSFGLFFCDLRDSNYGKYCIVQRTERGGVFTEKVHIAFTITIILVMLLVGCPNQVHLYQLNRVGAEWMKEGGNGEEEIIIADEETINLMKQTRLVEYQM